MSPIQCHSLVRKEGLMTKLSRGWGASPAYMDIGQPLTIWNVFYNLSIGWNLPRWNWSRKTSARNLKAQISTVQQCLGPTWCKSMTFCDLHKTEFLRSTANFSPSSDFLPLTPSWQYSCHCGKLEQEREHWKLEWVMVISNNIPQSNNCIFGHWYGILA